jgi:hypothetical protein
LEGMKFASLSLNFLFINFNKQTVIWDYKSIAYNY